MDVRKTLRDLAVLEPQRATKETQRATKFQFFTKNGIKPYLCSGRPLYRSGRPGNPGTGEESPGNKGHHAS